MISFRPIYAFLGLLALSAGLLLPAGAHGAFGLSQVSVSAVNQDGSVDLQAGSHPYSYNVVVKLNANSEEYAEGTLSTLAVELPPGLVGNPQATPRCGSGYFTGFVSRCPAPTQIGRARLISGGVAFEELPVFNLTPKEGLPATIGFTASGYNSLQEASVRTGADYGLDISDITIPRVEPTLIVEEIWGVPGEPIHDGERSCYNLETERNEHHCSVPGPDTPFLTLPTSCSGPLRTTVTVSSLEEPGEPAVTQSAVLESTGESGAPTGLFGCGSLPFAPSVSARPETATADSPSGFGVDLHLPQDQEPAGLATAHLKDAVVTLPKGLAVNPSAAAGLAACGLAEIDLKGSGPANCPPASKLGTVSIETPLVDHPLPGAVYLAKQGENPFGSLIALYIAVYDPVTGVVVKLPGKVTPDPTTGQLTATFENNPQLPFEDLHVDFFGGERAALTTPSTCGTYTTQTDLTPWSSPEAPDAHPSDSFAVSSSPAGGCPATESQMPNSPSLEAGTVSPLAGTYSPFVLKLARADGTQRISSIDTTLPAGLVGRLAGIPYCSDAAIAAAGARGNPGQGALEQASPSCPAASEVGTVTVGAGSGAPFYVKGHAYLAGPYKGAPLSLVIITPALAGPFDLGSVAVRTALFVDPETTRIHAVSDPLPTILQGVPLDLRSISLDLDRSDFTINPTSCEPQGLTAQALSTTGAATQLSNRFQVGGCGELGFKPKIAISLKGATGRTGHPALRAVVIYPKQGRYSNIARAQVSLPHSEFLDQGNIGTACTKVLLARRACRAKSIYGRARAWSPLLEKPLEGPVYLVGGYGYKLPALVAELNGQIRVLLVGRIDSDRQGGIRNTFEAVPDAPVSRFVLEMKGGKKYGLLQNSEDICAKRQVAGTAFRAQDATAFTATTKIANSCGHKKTKRGTKKH